MRTFRSSFHAVGRRCAVGLALCAAALCGGCAASREGTSVKSPDGRVEARLSLDTAGTPCIAIYTDGQPFLAATRIAAAGRQEAAARQPNLGQGFRPAAPAAYSECRDTALLPWGENKRLVTRYNGCRLLLRNSDSVEMALCVRVFDDGVAFRYEYLRTPLPLLLEGENTVYRFAQEGTAWSIPANFESYEFAYREQPLSQTADANTPLTFRLSDGRWGSLHEAALYDAPEMTLRHCDAPPASDGWTGPAMECRLCPDNSGSGTAAAYGRPPASAWRTVTIGRRAADLANSQLPLCCNRRDSTAADGSSRPWLKPIKFVGVWWGMHLGVNSWTPGDLGADGRSRHGATTENALRYIDFAAANHVDAVLFEGWNQGWEQWGGRQEFDFTAAAPDFDAERVIDYARCHGVQIVMHHETGGNMPYYEDRMEEAFQWCQGHGIHYVKTGYAGGIPDRHLHHSQYAVNHYRRVAECAARHEIALDVHEPIKPTGLRATYPNLMTGEGGRGMEWNAWSDGNTPAHTVTLPFTRLLAGPMDYTPGIFDITYRSIRHNPNCRKWNGKDARDCRVHTTLAKQAALWVVIYSPMVMAADLIENYMDTAGNAHPMFQFFRDYNPDCDWSETLEGVPGQYVVTARGAGDTVYVGAATNEEGRVVELPLDFLRQHGGTAARYEATIYGDAPEADYRTNPEAYQITRQQVAADGRLRVALAPGGGCAVVLRPVVE